MIIEAVIDPAGLVSNARVIRSVPLLDDAALDAVRQWEFLPTELNGQPVPVIMTVTVSFRLSDDGQPIVAPPPAPRPAPPTAEETAPLAQAPPPTWNPGDPPLRIGGQRPGVRANPPPLGQDTLAVLQGLGYTPAECAALQASGAVR